MIEHFLTEEKFQSGLRDYLAKHQYGNTETKDLWESLSYYEDNIPDDLYIQEIMDTWTKQAGYPVVISDGSTVSQERFFLNVTGNLYSFNFVDLYG